MRYVRAVFWAISLSITTSIAPGCGGEGGGGGPNGPSAAAAPAGTIIVDGSSTVFRISKAAQEAFKAVNPDVTVRREPRHRRRLQPLPPGRGRHRRRLARRPSPTRRRRPRRRGSSGPGSSSATTGSPSWSTPRTTSSSRSTVEQLKAIWAPGSKVKTWKDVDPSWPDRKIVLYSPRPRLGDVRVLHRGDRRQGQEPARGRAGQLRRQHPGQRRGRRRGRPRLLRLRLLRRQQGQAPRRRRSRTAPTPSRCCPSPETILDKTLRPALAAAVHLREELGRSPARGRRVPEVSTSRTSTTLAEKAGYVAPTAEDQAANQKALAGCSRAAAPKPSPAATAARSKESALVTSTVADRRRPTGQLAADAELWSGPSRFLRAPGSRGLGRSCSSARSITVLTTAGIILVLGVETIAFFRTSGRRPARLPASGPS